MAIAVGAGGRIYRSGDNGSTWMSLTSGVTTDLTSVSYLSGTTWFVGGKGGLVLKTIDQGASWRTLQTYASTPDILALQSFPYSTLELVFAAGGSGTMLLSTPPRK